MGRELYSVRMRAAAGGPHEAGGRHVSGAERIVDGANVERMVARLVRRAREHPLGAADFIQVTVERLEAGRVRRVPSLPVVTLTTGETGPEAARRVAVDLLAHAGVAPAVAAAAVAMLAGGPGPGGRGLRGAAVMDAAAGRRLEPDPARGVRVSRIDWAPGERRRLTAALRRAGIVAGRADRVADALAMASKVAHWGLPAEVGWSDDPDYTTGYVASPRLGYVRLPGIKAAGDPRGGRVFFGEGGGGAPAVANLLKGLEEEPALVFFDGPVRPPLPPGEFLSALGPARLAVEP